MNTKEAAVLIRQMVRHHFPTTKFSVRTRYFAGGSSIDVRWTDGPAQFRVDDIVNPVCGRGFNAMDDSTYVIPGTFRFLGQDYERCFCFIGTSRTIDRYAEREAAALARVRELFSPVDPGEDSTRAQRLLHQCDIWKGDVHWPETDSLTVDWASWGGARRDALRQLSNTEGATP